MAKSQRPVVMDKLSSSVMLCNLIIITNTYEGIIDMQIVVVNKVLKARIGHESCDTLEYPRCDEKKTVASIWIC